MLTYARDQGAFELYRKYKNDAGYDLATPSLIHLWPFQNKTIKTGVHILLEPNEVGMVLPRSSTSRAGVMIFPGVIDSDYRGDLAFQILNLTDEVVNFAAGHRLAQLVIMNLSQRTNTLREISIADFKSMESTQRGDNGFGSTGELLAPVS